jgi:hypothetical protein
MEDVRLERGPSFSFSDPIIPLVLLRLVSTPENKQRIGLDRNKTKSAHAPSVEMFFPIDPATLLDG